MAVDMFLKLDGIKGESHDKSHPGEIEIMSFSWGVSQTSVGSGGAGQGKVSVHDISITKVTDSASPQLMLSCAEGKPISSGMVTFRKAGDKPVEYLKIKLVDVLISSLQTGGSRTGTPSDVVTFQFEKMVFSAAPISPTGGLGSFVSATITNDEFGQFESPPPAAPA